MIRYYLESLMIRLRLKHQLSKEASEEYWRSPPDAGNQPMDYATIGHEKDEKLIEIFHYFNIPHTASILEIGCNAGRNLRALADAGYTCLSGIDINPDAIETCRELKTPAKTVCGEMGEILPTLGTFDVAFSTGVLMHVPYREDVYDSIGNSVKSGGYLITMEDEKCDVTYFYAKNYQKLFESRGYDQVYVEDLETLVTLRVLKKK